MNSTIQKRIEAIQSGKTPKGYKKTKWGIIPVQWEYRKIKDVCEINPSRNYNIDSDVTFIGMTDVSEDGKIKNQKQIPVSTVLPGLTPFMRGDILVAKITPCFENGKGANTSTLQTEYGFGSTEFHVLRSKIHNIFLFFHTIYPDFRNKLKSEMTGTAGQKRVSSNSISNYIIPLPPLSEQEAIAEILTQQDRLIDLLQKLIDEKRRQKKYLMQTLLTGRIRLPGFKGKWKTKTLGEIAKKNTTKNLNLNYTEVFTNSAQHGIIPQNQQFDKDIANVENIDGYYIVEAKDFVYNPRISVTAPCGPINMNTLGKTGVVSPLYTVFSIHSGDVEIGFIKHYFQSSIWHEYMKGIANYGARHDRMNISNDDFFAMPLPLPPLPEQEAIAEILSTADEELSLLERELEQEKLRKKALMQLLLTGLVRVEEL
ncbi:MAG: restriction endonuclease subunit S [Thermoguttaceae bacterium]|nr:restriction endonuclease subunit S [Thermoguttaceae bacterium]